MLLDFYQNMFIKKAEWLRIDDIYEGVEDEDDTTQTVSTSTTTITHELSHNK